MTEENTDLLETQSNTSSTHGEENQPTDENSSHIPHLNLQESYEESAQEKDITHPFREAIRLEDQIRHFQKEYDKLYAEVQTLHKILKVKEVSLSRVTVHIENERDVFKKTQTEIHRVDQELQQIREQNESYRNQRVEVGIDRILPEDRLDKEIQLENENELAQQEVHNLEKRIKDLQHEMKRLDKQIQLMNTKLTNLERYDRDYELECENSRLNIKINQLNDEIILLQQFTRTRTQQIEDLNCDIDRFKYLEQEHRSIQEEMEMYDIRMMEKQRELELAQNASAKKEKAIQELSQTINSTRALSNLEQDKRILYSNIKKQRKKESELERTTKWQQGEIEKLHIRLNTMNRALVDCSDVDWESIRNESTRTTDSGIEIATEKKNDGTTVTAEQFNRVVQICEKYRKSIKDVEEKIKVRDDEIETLEYRASILERSAQSDRRVRNRKLNQLRDLVDNTAIELHQLQLDYAEREDRLMQQAQRLAQRSEIAFGS